MAHASIRTPPPMQTGELHAFSRNHLRSLDGLRVISILLVLFGHGADALGIQNGYTGYLALLGVSTFFVISGMLITWLLIRENDETGSISLRNFYIRRGLRILRHSGSSVFALSLSSSCRSSRSVIWTFFARSPLPTITLPAVTGLTMRGHWPIPGL